MLVDLKSERPKPSLAYVTWFATALAGVLSLAGLLYAYLQRQHAVTAFSRPGT